MRDLRTIVGFETKISKLQTTLNLFYIYIEIRKAAFDNAAQFRIKSPSADINYKWFAPA